jgi:alkylresorcinol/alkylpyrone synthase
MTNVVGVGVALPEFSYSSAEILKGSKNWLKSSPGEYELFERFVSSSKIGRRYFGVPVERILGGISSAERAEIFWQEGTKLGVKAIANCLKEHRIDPASISQLIFTSCSVPVIPSIDARIIQEIGIPLNVRRLPIYQHGCAGGAAALGLAESMMNQDGYGLILSVELCSLVYQGGDLSAGNLVGSALFGDGAAAVLLDSKRGKFKILNSRSNLLPLSYELMGYDIQEDGSHLRLKKELPSELAQMAPGLIREFLSLNSINEGQIDHWLIHPGGVKILKLLEEEFKIQPQQGKWAWSVLEKYGNMSSASILFVLDEFIRSGQAVPGQKVMVLGIGPGLTLEQILIEVQG